MYQKQYVPLQEITVQLKNGDVVYGVRANGVPKLSNVWGTLLKQHGVHYYEFHVESYSAEVIDILKKFVVLNKACSVQDEVFKINFSLARGLSDSSKRTAYVELKELKRMTAQYWASYYEEEEFKLRAEALRYVLKHPTATERSKLIEYTHKFNEKLLEAEDLKQYSWRNEEEPIIPDQLEDRYLDAIEEDIDYSLQIARAFAMLYELELSQTPSIAEIKYVSYQGWSLLRYDIVPSAQLMTMTDNVIIRREAFAHS